MTATQPFIKFAITGGSSPSTSVSVHVYKSGKIITQVKNAWPIITTNDEVGVYKHMLSKNEISLLTNDLNEIKNLSAYYGEKQPGSLKYHLTISDTKNHQIIRWDHFATLPKVLEKISQLLQQVFKDSLQHNYKTIKTSLEISSNNTQNNATVYIHNTGKIPVTIILSENAIKITSKNQNNSPYVDLPTIYNEAISFPIEITNNSFTIAIDEKLAFNNTINLQQHTTWFAMIDLQLQHETIADKTIYCFLLTEEFFK